MDALCSTEELRCIVGEGPSDSVLKALLVRTNGDVSAAANRFFDGNFEPGPSESESLGQQVPDDVLSTLFKTLEDVGRKLAGASLAPHPPSCQFFPLGDPPRPI